MKLLIRMSALASLLIAVTSAAQITQEWVKGYSLSSNGSQIAGDVTTDPNGNVYLTGYNASGYSESDMMTLKFDSTGEYKWGKSYNSAGVAYAHDKGKCIVSYSADGSSFVYAAGEVAYAGNTKNIVLIKYDDNGNQKWVRGIYIAAWNQDHILKKIVADASGNVYLTGGTSDKAFLVKYDSSGVQRVARTFDNPPAYYAAQGNDIELAGNLVHIGAQIRNSSGYVVPALLICDTAGIQLQYVLKTSVQNPDDIKSNVAAGSSGHVFFGFSGGSDYRLTKYNSTGDTIWNRRYNGSSNTSDHFTDMAIDAEENIYLTGRVNGQYGDVGTVKFDSSGNLLWAQTYAGTGGWADEGKSIRLDASGNAYVAGVLDNWVSGTSLMLKYSPAGSLLWARTYDFAPGDFEESTALALDGNGNPVATGNCGYVTIADISAVKYDGSGNLKWARKYNASQTSTDAVNSVTADKNGNVFAIGRIRVPQFGDNIQILKYSPAGVLKWQLSKGSYGKDIEDAGYDIAVDKNGFVYYTGTMHTSIAGNKRDVYTGKLDSNGNNVWAYPHGILFGAGGNDEGVELKLDTAGNIFIGYNSEVTTGNVKFGARKYSPSGTLVWAYGYSSTGMGYDSLKDMKVDKEGNLYLLANPVSALSGRNIVTIKISQSGVHQWTSAYNGTADADDEARSLDVDVYGNVYVTGSAFNTSTGNDVALIKYGPAGNQLWAQIISNDNSANECGITVRYDSITGKIKLASNSRLSPSNQTLYIQTYDTSGAEISGILVNPSAYGPNYVTGGELDATGRLITAQAGSSQNSGYDMKVWRWDESFATYNGASSGNDIAAQKTPIVTSGNYIYAGVTSFDSVKGNVMTIVKYRSPQQELRLKMFIQGFYDSNYGIMIYDTVSILVRNSTPPYGVVDSARVRITFEGDAFAQFMKATGGVQYYISVNHRNSIETWSAAPVTFSTGLVHSDFTDSAEVFGRNLIRIESGYYPKFTVYSGDVNQDGTVDATDVSSIDNDASNFVGGYVVTDLTGDDFVDGTDFAIADNNAANFVSVIRP